MSTNSDKSEQLNIQFLGMKLNSINPGKKTVLLLVILLIFFLAMGLLLKVYILPTIVTIGGAKAVGIVVSKAFAFRKWIGGRFP